MGLFYWHEAPYNRLEVAFDRHWLIINASSLVLEPIKAAAKKSAREKTTFPLTPCASLHRKSLMALQIGFTHPSTKHTACKPPLFYTPISNLHLPKFVPTQCNALISTLTNTPHHYWLHPTTLQPNRCLLRYWDLTNTPPPPLPSKTSNPAPCFFKNMVLLVAFESHASPPPP